MPSLRNLFKSQKHFRRVIRFSYISMHLILGSVSARHDRGIAHHSVGKLRFVFTFPRCVCFATPKSPGRRFTQPDLVSLLNYTRLGGFHSMLSASHGPRANNHSSTDHPFLFEMTDKDMPIAGPSRLSPSRSPSPQPFRRKRRIVTVSSDSDTPFASQPTLYGGGQPRRKAHKRPLTDPSRRRTTRAQARRGSSPSLTTDLETIAYEDISVKAEITRLNLDLRDVQGDGNCLFRALADQLWGVQKRHVEVRKLVCDYLETHKEGMEVFVLAFMKDGEGYDGYVERMRQLSETNASSNASVLIIYVQRHSVVISRSKQPLVSFDVTFASSCQPHRSPSLGRLSPLPRPHPHQSHRQIYTTHVVEHGQRRPNSCPHQQLPLQARQAMLRPWQSISHR